jgi:hypothetical protein
MDVMIDSCVVDSFASEGFDPVADLRGTEFNLAYTPDLQFEYRQKADHEAASASAKALALGLLQSGSLRGFFGFGDSTQPVQPYLGFDQGIWVDPDQAEAIRSIRTRKNRKGPIPRNRTDGGLVAFAKNALVVTNDRGSHWKQAPQGKGRVIQWVELLVVLRKEGNVAKALRKFIPANRVSPR